MSTHPAKLGAGLDDRRGSTIDVDGDTREIAGPFRGQEGYHVASLVGFADPAQRNVAGFRALDVKLVKAQTGVGGFLTLIAPSVLAALNESDADGRDQDVVFGQIFRQGISNGDACRSGDGGGHRRRARGPASQVGGVDETATYRFAHFGADHLD